MITRKEAGAVCLVSLVTVLLAGSPAAVPQHDRAFWKGIVQADGRIPDGQSADALSDELSALLGDRDPELRDDIAYTLLATWLAVKPQISDGRARRLADRWTSNLRPQAADTEPDAVLLRSFSALSLAAVVARENTKPFLGEDRYRAVLDAGIAYFVSERDARGFDSTLGWVHATAHTADLLKFVGRNAYLKPGDQQRILQAIAGKVATTAVAWTYGEDERIARVVLSLVARPDLQQPAFTGFVADIGRLARFPEKPAPETLARYANARHLLTAMCAVFSIEKETPAIARARQEVIDALR